MNAYVFHSQMERMNLEHHKQCAFKYKFIEDAKLSAFHESEHIWRIFMLEDKFLNRCVLLNEFYVSLRNIQNDKYLRK